MKYLACSFFLSAASAFAIPATSNLTLVEEPGFNVLTIRVDPGVFPDTDTTTLSGAITADLDIDPSTDQTSELTLRDGRVVGTDMNFSGGFLAFGYNFDITNAGSAIFTTTPPGLVTAATGEFDATQHQASIDQGEIKGQALGNPVDENFSPEQAVAGDGFGSGNVSLTLTSETALYRNYDVTLVFPIEFADTFDANGVEVDVTANGTLKATGTVQVPRSRYIAWTIEQEIPGASGQDDENSDGLPNALAWAFGLSITTDARANLLQVQPSGEFQLQLPSTTVEAVNIQSSADLSRWSPTPSDRISSRSNPIPAGSTGVITISRPGATEEFCRLIVEE